MVSGFAAWNSSQDTGSKSHSFIQAPSSGWLMELGQSEYIPRPFIWQLKRKGRTELNLCSVCADLKVSWNQSSNKELLHSKLQPDLQCVIEGDKLFLRSTPCERSRRFGSCYTQYSEFGLVDHTLCVVGWEKLENSFKMQICLSHITFWKWSGWHFSSS